MLHMSQLPLAKPHIGDPIQLLHNLVSTAESGTQPCVCHLVVDGIQFFPRQQQTANSTLNKRRTPNLTDWLLKKCAREMSSLLTVLIYISRACLDLEENDDDEIEAHWIQNNFQRSTCLFGARAFSFVGVCVRATSVRVDVDKSAVRLVRGFCYEWAGECERKRI